MKIFFHVGMPKTGTTSLQSFLFANREALYEKGILYPIKPVLNYFEGQQVLLHPHISGSLEKSNECLSHFIQEGIDKKCKILLLSMESTQEFINFYDFKNFPVEIIQYIRMFPSFNESVLSQCLKMYFFNGIRGLHDLRLAYFGKNELRWIKDIQKKYIMHNFSFEKIITQGLIKHFLSLLDIFETENFIFPSSNHNISLSTACLFFIAHCNILPLPNHIRIQILQYIEQNPVCSDNKKYLLVEPKIYKLWIQEDQKYLNELSKIINEPNWIQDNLRWLEGKDVVPYSNLPAQLQHEIFHNLPQYLQNAIIEVWPAARQATVGMPLLPSLPESLERQENFFQWFKALYDLQMKEAAFIQLQKTIEQQKQQIFQLRQKNDALCNSLSWRVTAPLRIFFSQFMKK